MSSKRIVEILKKQAKALLKTHKNGDRSCCHRFRILRHFLDASDDNILSARIGLKECLEVFALDFGFRNWKKLTEHHDIAHQIYMGIRYTVGDGVRKNLVKGRRLLLKAANQGHAFAKTELGCTYASKNMAQAERWWKIAAARGDSQAHWCLGLVNARGDAGKVDIAEAAKWWGISPERVRKISKKLKKLQTLTEEQKRERKEEISDFIDKIFKHVIRTHPVVSSNADMQCH